MWLVTKKRNKMRKWSAILILMIVLTTSITIILIWLDILSNDKLPLIKIKTPIRFKEPEILSMEKKISWKIFGSFFFKKISYSCFLFTLPIFNLTSLFNLSFKHFFPEFLFLLFRRSEYGRWSAGKNWLQYLAWLVWHLTIMTRMVSHN